jgi:hypothetical protein
MKSVLGSFFALALLTGIAAQPANADCHWWQFRCEIEGLPSEAPRRGTVITIDLSTNTAYLFKDGEMIRKSACASGSEKVLENGDDVWLFRTPRGHLRVLRKIVDPIWRKPDWAFIEDGEPVPPLNSPKRLVKGHLGKYALDLGEGIMIHGTDDAKSIGQRVSHGCVRLPAKMLAEVYAAAVVGTDVFIFESDPKAVVERHSDLDFGKRVTFPSSSPAPDPVDPAAASTRSETLQLRRQ